MNNKSRFRNIVATIAVLGVSNSMASDLVVGVANWPSISVSASVIEKILEDNLGLDVEQQTGTNPLIFEGMSKGSMHVHPEVWLPNQANLVESHADAVVQNMNPAATAQGMCSNKAAREAGINHIRDLTNPDLAKLFDYDGDGRGEIYIGATGWASTTVEKVKAKGYGYDLTMDLLEIDETIAYAQLDDANTKGSPWVGFCYKPHHLFIVHDDLEFIEEPPHDASTWVIYQPDQDPDWLEKSSAAMAWPSAEVQLFYAKSLQDQSPEVATVLSNIAFTADDISNFSHGVVVEGKDATAVAADWIKTNEDKINKWLQ